MRAQLELWMLTKIAMLFFIISLAFIALNISNTEKSALCGEQALATSRIITSNINQVLSSSVEDARVVYKFEPTIAVSREKGGERYEVWLAERKSDSSSKTQLSVVVNPLGDATCTRRTSLFYDANLVKTAFLSNTGFQAQRDDVSPGEKVVVLTPSDRDDSKRSKFLIVVKCRDKETLLNHVYFDDCKNSNPDACSPLEPPAFTECE